MASVSEIQSLNEIQYKSKLKLILLILLAFFLFVFAFLSFYPIGDKLKSVIKSSFNGRGCNPDFDEIHMEWIMPKVVVTGLSIPASCLDRAGAPLKFNHLTLNYHIINFAPFGLPFKIETEFEGQPLAVYFVQGFSGQMVRLKDQPINLARLQPLLGKDVKLAGNVTVDLSMGLSNNAMSSLSLKAQSKDLQLPSQNIQGFTTPPLKLNEFYLEASSEAPPRIQIEKLILGDTTSPVRANFKGKIDLQQGNISFSPLDLNGEIAFSETLKAQVPVDMIFGSFNQKDGFYQIRLGGTLGAPQPIGQ